MSQREGTGLLVAREGPCFRLRTDDGRVLRALVRTRAYSEQGPFFVGDRVRYREISPGEVAVQARLERRNFVPYPRVANLDLLVIMATLSRPELDEGLLNRLLVCAEAFGVQPLVVLNKTDLAETEAIEAFCARYGTRVGYPVMTLSAKTGTGLDAVRERLRHRISALAGPSGVGKSTLLNRLIPGAKLRTREVAARTGRGRQTTTTVTLLPLPEGGLVADTPGFSRMELAEWLDPDELHRLFPEFVRLPPCGFRDCAHRTEPGCAVVAAVERGELDRVRYAVYQQLREEVGQARARRRS